jgi:hypothetical protein
MSLEEWFRGTDFAICISFPLSAVAIVFFAALAHSWGHVSFIGLVIAVGWSLALPPWVVAHVAHDKGHTRAPALWIESVLAGLWTGFGISFLLDSRATHVVVVVIAVAAGVAVALTPLWVRSIRHVGAR